MKKVSAKKMAIKDLRIIGEELFLEKPVWQNEGFENESRLRWEKANKTSKVNDNLRTGAGPFWRNLVDWVKAEFTREGLTTTIGDFRIWNGYCGDIDGHPLLRSSHFHRVICGLVAELAVAAKKEVI